ncbi:MAG: hypothetical protein EXX96DRAFT_561220 [Benjaminiella poitrasii]|nr:MAG: hypothetical protein EXX96DRAFT_561220 [Benjaminiella poitrasii]
MAFRSSVLKLSNKLTTNTAPMQWMRQISTSQIIRQAENNVKEETISQLPSILATDIRPTSELSTSLNAYSGRSIGSVANPNTAYRRLTSILNQNKVRRELRANRNYEKPNVARRRKNIERNRKLFGAMVGKKVALIMQMKNRGM